MILRFLIREGEKFVKVNLEKLNSKIALLFPIKDKTDEEIVDADIANKMKK